VFQSSLKSAARREETMTTLSTTDRDKIDAAIRSLRLWVLELVAWWAAALDNRALKLWLRAELLQTRKDIRYLLTGLVGVALRDGAVCEHPLSARTIRHARHTWTKRFIQRVATRGVRLRTLADIRAVLDDLHATAARCVHRYCTRRLRDIAQPPFAVEPICALTSFTPATEAADTS
jgi:hypothetical protein